MGIIVGLSVLLLSIAALLFTLWAWGFVFKICFKQKTNYIPLGKLWLSWDGFSWDEMYYFYWFNWLTKEQRYWGREDMYYDTPHGTFGLWYTNISWFLPWGEYNY